jgi:hypothetical protein
MSNRQGSLNPRCVPAGRRPSAVFPARFSRDTPSETARVLIEEARRLLRDAILTDEDRQFADWARTATPSRARCSCGKAQFPNHVAAAQAACDRLLHEEAARPGGSRWKVYTCSRGGLHLGR